MIGVNQDHYETFKKFQSTSGYWLVIKHLHCIEWLEKEENCVCRNCVYLFLISCSDENSAQHINSIRKQIITVYSEVDAQPKNHIPHFHCLTVFLCREAWSGVSLAWAQCSFLLFNSYCQAAMRKLGFLNNKNKPKKTERKEVKATKVVMGDRAIVCLAQWGRKV